MKLWLAVAIESISMVIILIVVLFEGAIIVVVYDQRRRKQNPESISFSHLITSLYISLVFSKKKEEKTAQPHRCAKLVPSFTVSPPPYQSRPFRKSIPLSSPTIHSPPGVIALPC